ncbi:MAG TPA: hypothetical protein VJ990_02720 [Clostridia bacterium]|nr:hypothetical protein [Clostridia bacterium]
MAKELKLNYRQLSWLGNAFEKHSIISPYKLIRVDGFDEKDKDDLINMGVVDSENKVLAEYFSELQMMAAPQGYVETVFKRGPIEARKMVYSKDDQKISLAYAKEGIVINSPSTAEGITNFMREYTGGSSLTGSDLELELPTRDMYLFAVLADLYRRDVFKSYAEEEAFFYKGFTKKELLDAANSTRKNSQSLAYHVYAVTGGTGLYESEEVEAILSAFEKKGLVKNENGAYSPVGEALLFSGNFLVVENTLDIVIGQIQDNILYRSGITILQAGPLDLAYLEHSQGTVTLQCMSAQSVLSIIQNILDSKPNII